MRQIETRTAYFPINARGEKIGPIYDRKFAESIAREEEIRQPKKPAPDARKDGLGRERRL